MRQTNLNFAILAAMSSSQNLPNSPRKPRGIYLLPNLFTTAGMFSGFYAIIAATQGKFEHACVAIFLAAVFDGMDGRIARLTNTQSEFGAQYDSMSDLVSFGLAPALVMYHWSLIFLRQDSVMLGKLGWMAAFLYAACGALRLARFNSQITQVDKRWFVGLASPAAASLMAAFIWTCVDNGITSGESIRFIALPFTAIVGLLMFSRFFYTSFKGSRSDGRVPFWVMLLLVLAIIGVALNPPVVLFAVFGLYALYGPVAWLLRKITRRAPPSVSVTPHE